MCEVKKSLSTFDNNNKKKNNVRSAWRPVSGCKLGNLHYYTENKNDRTEGHAYSGQITGGKGQEGRGVGRDWEKNGSSSLGRPLPATQNTSQKSLGDKNKEVGGQSLNLVSYSQESN